MKLYILIGLPGSGKSTYAKRHTECTVINPDRIRKELYGSEECQEDGRRVFGIAFYRLRKAISENKDVIFDATNITRWSRKQFFKFNAEVIAVFFNTDKEECKKRNAARSRIVPEQVIDNMASRLEIPLLEEGFSEIIII